jgi:hypothetical protein
MAIKRTNDDLFAGPFTLPRFCDPNEARRRMALGLVMGEYVEVPFHMHKEIIGIASEMLRQKMMMRPQDWARTVRKIQKAENEMNHERAN